MFFLTAPLPNVLSLSSVTQITGGRIRVTFTTPPLMNSASGIHDSLNQLNYAFNGQSTTSIASITPVSGDPNSIDLYFANQLLPGNYVLYVKNITTAPGTILTAPISFSINILNDSALLYNAIGTTEGYNAETSLRDFTSPALVGQNWSALISAIAKGDSELNTFSQSVFNQGFLSTAAGKYLDRLAANIGLHRFARNGVNDAAYRNLAISLNANKLTLESFLNVIDAYYGDDFIRASIDSGTVQPYNLTNAADLLLNVEGNPVTVIFHTADFANIGQATALEVCNVINRYLLLNGFKDFAKPILNPLNGTTIVRLYSSCLGLRGSLSVFGGLAQNTLQFPTILATTPGIGTTWTVDTQTTIQTLGASVVQFTWTGGQNPNLQLVHVNDYVAVYGTPFNINNRGSFIITNVTNTTFQIVNPIGFAQAGVSQVAANDIAFYRPTKFTLNSKNFSSLVVSQPNASKTSIILGATSPLVSRGIDTAAYLQSNIPFNFYSKLTLTAGSLVRTGGNTVTVTTPVNHNLLLNDKIFIGVGEPNFIMGTKTVSNVGGLNTFQYTETGSNVSSVNTNYLYYNFRDQTGTTYLTTTANNGYSTGQQVYIDGFVNDINTVGGLGFNTTVSGSGTTLYQRQSVLLQNGQVLVCGGATSGAVKSNLSYLYTPSTNTWVAGPNMNTARSGHTATLLNDGRVLVVGGGSATCEIYYPTANIFVNAAINAQSRSFHATTLLNDGRVLVVGGGFASSELFNPVTDTWSNGAAPNYDVQFAKAITLNNGNVLIASGQNGGGMINTALLYNPFNNTFRLTVNNPIAATYFYRALLLPKGVSSQVYIIGGVNASVPLANVQIFDPPTETWIAGPTLNTARFLHALSLLPNNQIIVYGGLTNFAGTTDTNTYEILDFINGSSWQQASGTVDQYGTNGILLANNDVLFTAGISISSTSADYLYVPQSSSTITNSGDINTLTSIIINTAHQFSYTTKFSNFTNIATLNNTSVDNKGNIINATVLSFKAVADPMPIGPYLWSTKDGFNITSIGTTLNQTINAGLTYENVTVTSTTNFPNSGYLIFNFGFSTQTAPVRYFTVASGTQLIIDSSFVFPFTLIAGATVIVLNGKGASAPANAISLGSFYLTDSSSGRISAQNTISLIEAAGLNINISVNYPGGYGLGAFQSPTSGSGPKFSDLVYIYGG